MCAQLEISFRMCTYRAYLRRVLADMDMAAVSANPYHITVFRENETAFYILKQLAVTLFMFFFDFAYCLKKIRCV